MSFQDTESNGSPTFTFPIGTVIKWLCIALGGIIALSLVVFVLLAYVIWPQTLESEANRKQSDLMTAYSKGVTQLNECITLSLQTAQVASANAEAVRTTLAFAITGKGDNPAAQLDANTPAGRNGLYTMLVQTWPDLKGQTDLFAKTMDTLVGCRGDVRGRQDQAITMANDYAGWLGGWRVRNFAKGLPNDRLEVSAGRELVARGPEALRIMQTAIVNASTADAVKTGIDKSADMPLFSTTPAPSTTQ